MLFRFPRFIALAIVCTACATASDPSPTDQAQDAVPVAASEILWDSWGVPHVFATDVEDAGYGFGWAQMHAHGDAVLRLYGLARGRGAEYWGEEYLASDRLMTTLGIPESGAAGLAAQEPEFRRYLEAFAAGVNAYASTHPERIADEVESVLPVEAADLLRHAQRTGFIFLALNAGEPRLVEPDGMPAEESAGSNAWAIAPKRSASGNALLLANPHLPWTIDELRFFEAHLVAPGMNVYGAATLGLPVIAIGFNDRLGWTHTVNTFDGIDLYRLRLAGDGYRWDGAVRPFENERKTLRVRSADGTLRTEPLLVRRSVHGPVVRQDDTTALALRSVFLEQAGGLRQWWEMGRARGLAEFEAALRRLEVPMFTVIYADREGHVLSLFNGRVPERPFGDFATWQRPVRGDTSATLWTATLPYDRLPRVVDPPAGWVQNSNSPPWFTTMPSPLDPDAFPAYLAPRGVNFREQRGIGMLRADSSITLDELEAMRYATEMLLADRVLDELLPAARGARSAAVREAAEVLAGWDGRADADSRGGVLFGLWAAAFRPHWSGRGFAEPWDPREPASSPSRLADGAGAVAALDSAAAKLRAQGLALDVPWGEVNRLGVALELPGNGAPGDPFGVFHVIGYQPTEDGPARAVFGDSYVALVEFTPEGPRARVLLGYGNASQPGSPHLNDQLPLLSAKRMRPAWRTREQVEAHLEMRTPIVR